MVHVVIIDSGVDLTHPAFAIDTTVVIDPMEPDARNCKDYIGHGTAIYGIIRQESNIKITNIKINKIETGVTQAALIAALNYINNELKDVKVVNMSLGTVMLENDELFSVCKALSNKGVILVAAFDNQGSYSYPAAFDCVIGVSAGNDCHKKSDYHVYDDPVLNMEAFGGNQRVCWTKPRYQISMGNSFACAHATVLIIQKIKKGNKTMSQVLSSLKQSCEFNSGEALENPKMVTVLKKRQSIKKAILFPLNKEMHSLIRFERMLDFEIVGVVDSKYSGRCGAVTSRFLNYKGKKEHVIISTNDIEMLDFDTVILGHVNELLAVTGTDREIQRILNCAQKKKASIYSFDSNILKYATCLDENATNLNVFYPKITKENIPIDRKGMLYSVSKPVVAIFGTSSNQGKFSLQLMIRENLIARGYSVSQLGTEPSSLLFGINEIYPMGYNSEIEATQYEKLRWLNSAMNRMSREPTDIILVGSQSGSVTYDFVNTSMLNFEQYVFLCGTLPDAVVLCINAHDDMEYIERSILFLESSVDTKVIALSLFPLTVPDDWRGEYGHRVEISDEKKLQLKKDIEKKFSRKLFFMDDNGTEALTETIIDYLQE